MDSKMIEAFLASAEHGSFAKAAETLGSGGGDGIRPAAKSARRQNHLAFPASDGVK